MINIMVVAQAWSFTGSGRSADGKFFRKVFQQCNRKVRLILYHVLISSMSQNNVRIKYILSETISCLFCKL